MNESRDFECGVKQNTEHCVGHVSHKSPSTFNNWSGRLRSMKQPDGQSDIDASVA